MPLLINQINKINTNFTLDTRLIDVSNIYRQQFTRTLSDAYKTYTNKEMTNAHDATADVFATAEIFANQITKFDKFDLDELELYSNYGKQRADLGGKLYYNDNNELCFNFGKCKDKTVESEVVYATWTLRQDFPSDFKMLVRNAIY